MAQFRKLNSCDKLLIVAALANVGATDVRVRQFRFSFRVCIDSEFDRDAVIEALNNEGYRNAAGEPFTKFSFNQPHEIFVHLCIY